MHAFWKSESLQTFHRIWCCLVFCTDNSVSIEYLNLVLLLPHIDGVIATRVLHWQTCDPDDISKYRGSWYLLFSTFRISSAWSSRDFCAFCTSPKRGPSDSDNEWQSVCLQVWSRGCACCLCWTLVVVLVLDDTSLLKSYDFYITSILFVSLFALRTSQVNFVGNSRWFFNVDFAHQLIPRARHWKKASTSTKSHFFDSHPGTLSHPSSNRTSASVCSLFFFSKKKNGYEMFVQCLSNGTTGSVMLYHHFGLADRGTRKYPNYWAFSFR